MKKRVIIAGGGAAGFFAAVNIASMNPLCKVLLLEKSSKVLQKVKVSGGGRCNVTHACFDPKELTSNYPRGARELLGPFFHFQPSDTIEWFQTRGVELKTEADGRMFPVSNSSQTIIDCLLSEANRCGVEVQLQAGLKDLISVSGDNNHLRITTTNDEVLEADAVVITTGSSNSTWQLLGRLGHHIISPVPSLFTFNIVDKRTQELPGLSVPRADINVEGYKYKTSGPLLITHWGLSGPAILKMSAVAARELADMEYRFFITINWMSGITGSGLMEEFISIRKSSPARLVKSQSMGEIPARLWNSLLPASILNKRWADLNNEELNVMAGTIVSCRMEVTGKSTFKEEFVTAGGVDLKEVDFRTMESKLIPGLFFAGEVLNIDALTGGFNFQAAWTEAYIAAEAISGL